MKNKVLKRLQELESINTTSESQNVHLQKELNKEVMRLTAYADALKSRDFGFVSTFKGVTADLWRGNDRIRLNHDETAKIVNKIQEEYRCALEVKPTIERIRDIVSQCKDTTKNRAIIKRVEMIADRALNGCIEKGYNFPAIEILSSLSVDLEYGDQLTIRPKRGNETEYYIKKIASNYAKKEIYNDNASYLGNSLDGYRHKEIEFKTLRDAIIRGQFGYNLSKYSFVDEIKNYYEQVGESSWDSPTAQHLSSTPNMRSL